MKRIILGLACLGMLVGVDAFAQTRIVNTTGFAFVDSVSGTNVTTITLGTTIQWVFGGGASHTVTSGVDSNDPNAGALFNSPLNSMTTMYSYTPSTPGVIPYHCVPHQFFGMLGTIIVNSPFMATYPGTNEDFELGTAVNTPGNLPLNPVSYAPPADIKVASAFDALTISMRSVLGTFNYVALILVAQPFMQGSPPPGAFPGLHVNTFGAVILINGLEPSGLPAIVLPGGVTYGVLVPPGLVGFSVMIQALAVSPTANNGFFATTIGHEIRVM